MDSFANQSRFVAQVGTNATPDGYTPLGQETDIVQEAIPSSPPNGETSNLPCAQSNYSFANLPPSAPNMDSLGTWDPLWPGSDGVRESFNTYSDNSMMNRPFIGEPNTWTATPAALPQYSDTQYFSSAVDMTSIYPAPTANPLHHAATPHVKFTTELTDINAAAMPPPPLSATQESSVLNIVAESAKLRGTRLTEEDWTNHQSTIKELYMDQNMTLPSLMDVMKSKYGFCAPQKRYKQKFKTWGFDKNLTRRQSKYMTRTALKRLGEGKKTEFHLKGNVIPQEKVDRHLAKPKVRSSSTGSCPSGLSYQTLRPGSQSLVSRRSPTLRSQQLMPSPSYPQPFSPDRNQRPRLDDLDTTTEPTLHWQGLDLEALGDLCTRAIDLAEQDPQRARMMFWDAMDGFESLVGATHHSTVEVLSSFGAFCLKAGFFDEAKDRMQKSLADHQAKFGDTHQQTLMSMVRLGQFFLAQELYGNAETILIRAKIGFEGLFRDDAEELFVHTLDISESLADMYKTQDDFGKCEQEHLSMIRKGEVLQGPYVLHVLRKKYSQAHLYKYRPPNTFPLLKLERLLLECIEACEHTSALYSLNLSFLELLREQYHKNGEDLKLENLLERIVHKIEAIERARKVFIDTDKHHLIHHLIEVKNGLACSYLKLGSRGEAERRYLRIQPEIESHHGVNSREALRILIQIGLTYLERDEWDEAEPYFQDAQRRADIVLKEDDPIKERIAHCLTTQIYVSECSCCMV